MNFQLTFKTPDVLDQLREEVEGEDREEEQMEAAQDVIKKFLRYGESITVEFDTKTQTATVVH